MSSVRKSGGKKEQDNKTPVGRGTSTPGPISSRLPQQQQEETRDDPTREPAPHSAAEQGQNEVDMLHLRQGGRQAMSARFRQLEPARRQKGTAGRVAVWGGSSLYCGAPYFACQAAVQLGVDLVFLKPGHPSVAQAVKARSLDIMCDADHHAGGEGVTDNNTNSILERCDALVVGPGLGRAKATVDALQEFFAGASSRAQGEGGGAPRWPRQKPLVIDADGLFALFMVEVV